MRQSMRWATHCAVCSVVELIEGFEANHVLEYLAQRDIEAVIPPKKANRVEQREYDRNLVERFFGRLKQFRRIAMLYEKLARNFFGMLSLACAYIWLA